MDVDGADTAGGDVANSRDMARAAARRAAMPRVARAGGGYGLGPRLIPESTKSLHTGTSRYTCDGHCIVEDAFIVVTRIATSAQPV